jgi:HEAT repeat protein
MSARKRWLLLLCLLVVGGCKGEKSTGELIADLKSGPPKERIIAARLLQHRQQEAAEVVPALIEALKDKSDDVRLSAAIGLGYFGDQAKEAIPALKEMAKDSDFRLREAAGVAMSSIDPTIPKPTVAKPAKK